MTENSSYKEIYKSTFLFSFVKVFQILIGILKNKVIAILLGPEGVGIIGILMNTVNLLQTGGGLGISRSAVRDISEANGSGNSAKFSRIISLTNRVILFTCLLGFIVTVFLSPVLSQWTFGDKNYTVSYLWLALVVGLNILTEGQLAILMGMRQLRALAKASMIGSIVGLITTIPLYYIFGKTGIVPGLIITAFSAVFFSNYFVRKIKYDKTTITLKQISKEASPMVRMGVALMFVGFLGLAFNLIIVAYIRSCGGLADVGLYQAGTTIIASYFGVVLTAMTTDYYPRISTVHNDNVKLQDELNRQSEVGLILIFPIAVLFVFLSPILIKILYSSEFLQTITYTDYAILGTILVVCSNSLGMILLAKQDAKTFTLYSLLHQLVFLPIYIFFYTYYALLGLGIVFLINVSVQFLAYILINRFKYNICFKRKLYKQLLLVFSAVLLTIIVRKIDDYLIKYLLGGSIFIFSCLYSYSSIRNEMNINPFHYIRNKLKL
ncbi:MAG: oligosaccharide flippase family protein [Paludibacter sp.]|nr:oligosaccharide flippase family protein [Paludibacter sp.]